jgi:hypothetical protein
VDVGVLFDPVTFPDRGARGRAAERLATGLIGATHRNAVDVVSLNDAPPELVAPVVSGPRVSVATGGPRVRADGALLQPATCGRSWTARGG